MTAAQLSLGLDEAFAQVIGTVLASDAFADLCRSLAREPGLVDAAAKRAEELRDTWDGATSPTAWCHALAVRVAAERKTARREYERAVLPLRDSLYGAAMKLTRDPAEADDLVQDTMLRAWRFWASFAPGTDVKAWMFTILRNTFINGYHKRERAQDFRNDVAEHVRHFGSSIAVSSATSAPPRPDDAEAVGQKRARIMDALAQLPRDYRLAVSYSDLDGLSYKEIAEVMECPIGTVMSRIYRGRKLMRRLLDDLAPVGNATDVAAVHEVSATGGR